RASFVTRHRRFMLALGGCGAALAGAAALSLGPRPLALAGVVAALGLLHRRLKRFAAAKPVYLTFAWTAVPVGLPAAAASFPPGVAWVAVVVGASVLSNVILSNLRDREALAARYGARRARRVAGLCALASLAAALLGPRAVHPLAALGLAMGAAVVGFPPTERAGA